MFESKLHTQIIREILECQKHVFTLSNDGSAKVLDLSFKVLRSIQVSDSLLYCMDVFDKDNMACTGEDNRLILVSQSSGSLILPSSVWGMRILRDDEQILAVSDDGFI